MSGVGHNSQLPSFIQRVEKLLEEKDALSEDIKEVFSEAKGMGFDVPAMRRVIRLRRMDPAKRKEQASIDETYMLAMGMLD